MAPQITLQSVFLLLLVLPTAHSSAPKPTTPKPTTKHPSHLSPSPPPPPPPTVLSTLITRTCAATSRPSLCSSSLQSSPEALSATEPAALCAVLLSLSAANASSAATSTTALAANITSSSASTSDARRKLVPLLRACAGRYGDAATALRDAEASVETEDFEYAYIHASAALEYPHMCKDMFAQNKAAYPLEMAKTEGGFVALCTVAVEIVAILGE